MTYYTTLQKDKIELIDNDVLSFTNTRFYYLIIFFFTVSYIFSFIIGSEIKILICF